MTAIRAVAPLPLARLERFDRVGSTNDVVAGWLAGGTPEVCVAVAAEQTAGRGRDGRRWLAPPGRSLLVSLGFRPRWLPPERAWRIPATASLAMAEAAERVAGLADATVALKWPNDLVARRPAGRAAGRLVKLGGVLGESTGLGGDDPRVVIGIGLNADWPPAEFPAALAGSMTSLRQLAGRPIATADLLDAFLERLAERIAALRDGAFDAGAWEARQAATGRLLRIELEPGRVEERLARGVDPESGALLVEEPGDRPGAPGGARPLYVGEVVHVRLAEPAGGV